MKRSKKVEVRLTEQELSDIKNKADSKGVSVSYYIRDSVKGNAGDVDKRKIAMHLFNMQTFLNQTSLQEKSIESINFFEREMNELWQYLNS